MMQVSTKLRQSVLIALECRQLMREQMDMMVMGQLRALCHRDPQMQKSKAKNTDRKREPLLSSATEATTSVRGFSCSSTL